jgi:Na+-translocating ferredoxin:NAD+ oxidoreductase RNF subunit RnfB
MNPIVIAALVVGGTGILCAGALAAAAKAFYVHEDPRIGQATELLPGANCGGCGFAGCADYGKAVVIDGAAINLCAPGGDAVIAALASLLGKEATAAEKNVAFVLCGGSEDKAPRKFDYNGVADCAAAHAVGGGDKLCGHGCLGYGSCARACPEGAIEITSGRIALVHPELCIGCGACVKTCPRQLIKMIPASRAIHVLCSSRDKGPAVKKVCKVGCIGCTVCTKLADNEAIRMDGPLAIVDYTKELTDEKCVEKCPGKCIVKREVLSS